jgi:hypothetical protein
MPAWPATLPSSPLSDGFRETLPDTVIRTQMDQGPAKLRRRTGAGTAQMSLAYLMDRAQVEALTDFFNEEVAGGAYAFTFAHPVTGAGLSCRFRQPPQYAPLNGEWFRVSLELEALP